jgi:hypothetical protein
MVVEHNSLDRKKQTNNVRYEQTKLIFRTTRCFIFISQQKHQIFKKSHKNLQIEKEWHCNILKLQSIAFNINDLIQLNFHQTFLINFTATRPSRSLGNFFWGQSSLSTSVGSSAFRYFESMMSIRIKSKVERETVDQSPEAKMLNQNQRFSAEF